jgi:hypothetical protein
VRFWPLADMAAPFSAAVPLYVSWKKRSAEQGHLYPVLDLLHGKFPKETFSRELRKIRIQVIAVHVVGACEDSST